MSTSSYFPFRENRELLGELLHSVSQPLTTLRCSLECSLDEAVEHHQQTIAMALEQTENVIAMISLMREYLDAEEGGADFGPGTALMPVLRNVSDALSPLAAVRSVRLKLIGACPATLPVRASCMRKAMEYLVWGMIERQPVGSEIIFRLEEASGNTLVRFEGERGFGFRSTGLESSIPERGCFHAIDPATTGDASTSAQSTLSNPNPRRNSAGETMMRVRLAIAARVLESAGATVVFDEGFPGLVLRIPTLAATPAEIL